LTAPGPASSHFAILVAIESDATRYRGDHAQRPRLLDASGAQQVLAHLASDLHALFPRHQHFTLSMPGALFDQTQVLRPGWPLFEALDALAQASPVAGPSLLGIGARDGRMPHPGLQPDPDISPAPLQLLPLLLAGPADELALVAEQMEHRFLGEGQLSAHSALGLAAAFGIDVVHARFMTLNDLLAMQRLQLEHFGFLPLWELLDAALDAQTEPLSVVGQAGQVFEWDGARVRCQFETFDAFARRDPHTAEELPERYAAWTREYRQYLLTLAAHGVPLVQHLPGIDTPLEGNVLVESLPWSPDPDACGVTEQGCAELGVIAITVVDGEQLLNFYPLNPRGLDEMHRQIREAGHAARGFAYPGRLLFDPANRCLVPERA